MIPAVAFMFYYTLVLYVAGICDAARSEDSRKNDEKNFILTSKIVLWGWTIPIVTVVLAPIGYIAEKFVPPIGHRNLRLLTDMSRSKIWQVRS